VRSHLRDGGGDTAEMVDGDLGNRQMAPWFFFSNRYLHLTMALVGHLSACGGAKSEIKITDDGNNPPFIII
jgi:hypothetical protein